MKYYTAISTLFMMLSVSLFAQKDGTAPSDTALKGQMVLIHTEFGDMKVLLYDVTPKHRDNFIKLVETRFYDSLLFHRVIKNFMIQGGDPLSKNAPPEQGLGMGDVGYTVPAEFNDTLFHRKGALAAARFGENNPLKNSSGCQFYIVQGQTFQPEQLDMMALQQGVKLSDLKKSTYSTVGGYPPLDNSYTVFGQVIEGLDVIDKIANVQIRPNDHRPLQDVRMKITLIKPEPLIEDMGSKKTKKN